MPSQQLKGYIMEKQLALYRFKWTLTCDWQKNISPRKEQKTGGCFKITWFILHEWNVILFKLPNNYHEYIFHYVCAPIYGNV